MSEKRLEKLLNTNSGGDLGDLIRHAREMGELLQQLQNALPREQGAAIEAANVREDGELVILASSPAWASRLRFETEALMAAAGETGRAVTRCTVRVARNRD